MYSWCASGSGARDIVDLLTGDQWEKYNWRRAQLQRNGRLDVKRVTVAFCARWVLKCMTSEINGHDQEVSWAFTVCIYPLLQTRLKREGITAHILS
jgi:hypothetical protein